MLIAVLSDTHRMGKYINMVREHIKKADILIHLGDNVEDAEELSSNFHGEVYIVSGNCDYSTKYPKERVIEIEDKRIFLTHGDLYGVKYNLNNIYYRTRELDADIALFGHTHKSIIEKVHNITLMNPGSLSLPKNEGRYIGFLELNKGEEPNIYLEEISVN
ncbi:YfcE family phosphodiesterase [Clostridium uliginosum]|uniref:Phosphoesterase n=1 Tax=Clostridium uliginosum TaxID=119641 RepID=A0A1I1J8P7_9CLOT|nr:metallophosphoesterase [Clostridium uliginosum]SFC44491.1 hypothetical protein SAMN05421842_103218 [Clostridium uliginosum]